MKTNNILFVLFMFLSQQIYSQEYPLDYVDDVPNGAYYKDLNHELDKYVGLWMGNWNGKTVYLELKKVKTFNSGSHYYYKDRILGERKIIDTNGNVEIDRISNFDNENSEFWGIGVNLKNTNIKRLYFYPKNMCGKMATLDITNLLTTLSGPINNPVPTGTEMTLHFEYLPSIYDENCIHNNYIQQNGDFPINFPKDIVLTKQ